MSIDKEIKKVIREFPKRFTNKEIKNFIEEGFSPKDVEKFDKWFNASDITYFLGFNISPEKANEYSRTKRFTLEDIPYLIEAGCSVTEAEKYKPRRICKPQGKDRIEVEIEGLSIAYLFKAGFKSEEGDKYSPRFSWGEIDALHGSGCDSKQAEKYDSRFDGYDIGHLTRLSCSFERSNQYNKRFTGNDIVHLNIKNAVPPEIANKYDSRFSGYEIKCLVEEGCLPKKANVYNKRFHGTDIPDLVKSGCSPKQADKYNKRFEGGVISELFKHHYTPAKANKYIRAIKLFRQKEFIKEGVSPKQAEEYNKTSENYEMVNLIKMGCSVQKLKKYHPRFKWDHVSELVGVKCSHAVAKKYDARFDAEEIASLIKAGCSHLNAQKYDKTLDGEKIAILYSLGFKPSILPQGKQDKLFLLFNRVIGNISFNLSEVKDAKKLKSLGVGASGMVLLKENTALKFSKNISNEYGLLKKIQDYHKNNQKNIIKIKSTPKKNVVLELEYIHGDSLENLLKKHGPLPKSKILSYSSDIINGLIEMRQAGVWYHRDIRPANILIDEKNDKAVIIDFGIATTDRHALPQDNRRYGGVNDLVSLGQLMYKMAFGEHIFAESKSMETTTKAKKLKDYRDKVYSDKTYNLLDKHLKQVDIKINDKPLRTLIKSCLTAKNYEYKKIKRLFSEISD